MSIISIPCLLFLLMFMFVYIYSAILFLFWPILINQQSRSRNINASRNNEWWPDTLALYLLHVYLTNFQHRLFREQSIIRENCILHYWLIFACRIASCAIPIVTDCTIYRNSFRVNPRLCFKSITLVGTLDNWFNNFAAICKAKHASQVCGYNRYFQASMQKVSLRLRSIELNTENPALTSFGIHFVK